MLPQCIFFIFQPEGVLMLFPSCSTIAPCLSIIETQLSTPFERFTLNFVANSILLTFARFRATAGEAIISSTAWGLQRFSFGQVFEGVSSPFLYILEHLSLHIHFCGWGGSFQKQNSKINALCFLNFLI